MKLRHTFCIILLVNLCFATSCNSGVKDIPVVDVDNPAGTIDLTLSDLLDDITIVPLETRDDLLLTTAGTSFIVTNRYILVKKRDEELLQFDHQGKYIRTLATHGNGPNEFDAIGNSLTDEEQEIFYYSDYGHYKYISCIDLKTGVFRESLYPDIPRFSIKAIDGKGNIYGFPARMDSTLLAFRYNPVDKSVTAYKKRHPSTDGNMDQEMFRQGDHIFFVSFSYSDTLFKIDGTKTIPQYRIKVKDLNTGNPEEGNVKLRLINSYTQGTVIEKSRQQILMDESGRHFDNYVLAYLFVNKNCELQTIRSVTVDPLAFTIDMDDYLKQENERRRIIPIGPPDITGLWGHIAVEASDMIALIDKALKGHQLFADQRKALVELSAKIDEDSNPVLIIGRVK